WKGRNKPRRGDRRWVTAWSPEQISNRLKLEFPDDESMRISHEAIYQLSLTRFDGHPRSVGFTPLEGCSSWKAWVNRGDLVGRSRRSSRRRSSRCAGGATGRLVRSR